MANHSAVLVPDCTCHRFRQVARLLSRNYDAFLAEFGISIGQFSLLSTIASGEGDSITQIAEAVNMDRTTLTRNLTPLQRMGYIATTSGSDKRTRSIRLSPAGVKILKAAMPKWRAAQLSLEKQLGKTKTNMLNAMLDDALHRLSAER
jgi:DNA-binding MarR family transcriptional regulator